MKREVFYIAGYDPKSYRFYYDLFRKNLENYSKNFNFQTKISKINKTKNFPFFELDYKDIKTKYHFLTWNDIVKKNWSNSVKDALIDAFMVFKIYIITGLFMKFKEGSIYQLITGFYPFFYVLFSLIFSVIFGIFIFFFATNYINFYFALILGILSTFVLHNFLFKFGKKLAVFWIARICVFCAKWQENKGFLEKRIRLFVSEISKTLKTNENNENFELILVSHSVGSIMLIEILYSLLSLNLSLNLLKKVKILTLGECIPLISYQKKAFEFRKKLEVISRFDFKWYDYTSIIDGACFPMIDFFRTSGVEAKFSPVFLSAKFHTLYEKNEYKKIKKDKNKAHFLYLYSPSIKGEFDFFYFIFGDKFLEEKVKL